MLNKFLRFFSGKILWEVEHHKCITYLNNESCTYQGKINPLQDDEADYQLSKHNIKDFKFNGGYYSFTQNYFIACLTDVFIEPEHFIAIKGFTSIIKESFFFDWYKISKSGYLQNRLLKFYKIKNLEDAIIFDAPASLNYFHFFNDTISKLDVIDKTFKGVKIPLIISEKLFNSILFQFFYQFQYVRNNNWYVVSGKTFLKVHKLYIVKARQYDVEAIRKIADLGIGILGEIDYPLIKSEKIFINRKPETGRYISNFNEIGSLLIKYGFNILYMEDLSLGHQIAYMKEAKLIVGIHGAGLTNIIFANKNNPAILEILPINFAPTHYYWLCNSFSLQYKAFYGEDLMTDQSFKIDVQRFEKIISKYK